MRGVCDLGARNRFKNIKIEIDQYNVNKQKTGFFFTGLVSAWGTITDEIGNIQKQRLESRGDVDSVRLKMNQRRPLSGLLKVCKFGLQ